MTDTIQGDLAAPSDPPVGSRGATSEPSAKRRRATAAWALGAIVPVGIIVLWQVLATLGVIDTRLFPAPSQVVESFVDLIRTGRLWDNFLISLWRATLGFIIGAGLGMLVGLWSGFSITAERLLDPTLQMLRTVPLLAVTPLFILWFGFGEVSKVALIATGAFFPIYVNTFLGVRGVDRKLFDVSTTLNFSLLDKLRLLVFPAALPNILLGLRLSVGMAWLCLVVAELMGATSGIGYLIQDARSLLDTATVVVGIIIFAVVGKVSDSLIRFLERWLLRWQETYRG